MVALNWINDCAGNWTGTNCLQDTYVEDKSPATATVTPVLGGKFVRFDYTWSYHGKPQEGSLLLGFDGAQVTAHWIDTWHMRNKVMACQGLPAEGELNVLGSYVHPPGPDWGWRIVLTCKDERLSMVMFNIDPEGLEELAVEAIYRRP